MRRASLEYMRGSIAGEVQCACCMDTGRVCENHLDRPWRGLYDGPGACDCGPGAECPYCIDPAGPRGVPGVYRGMTFGEVVEMLGGRIIAIAVDEPESAGYS